MINIEKVKSIIGNKSYTIIFNSEKLFQDGTFEQNEQQETSKDDLKLYWGEKNKEYGKNELNLVEVLETDNLNEIARQLDLHTPEQYLKHNKEDINYERFILVYLWGVLEIILQGEREEVTILQNEIDEEVYEEFEAHLCNAARAFRAYINVEYGVYKFYPNDETESLVESLEEIPQHDWDINSNISFLLEE